MKLNLTFFSAIVVVCILIFIWIGSKMEIQWNPLLQQALSSNPGLLTTFVTVFLVPIGVLLLTNHQQRALKAQEKELSNENEKDKSINQQQDLAYGALVNILFEVQQLHTELSLPKCDPACVDRALQRFKTKLFDHQSKISENQIQLKPYLIDHIYRFYTGLSKLEIELANLADDSVQIRQACVAANATELADLVTKFQRGILTERGFLTPDDVYTMQSFRTCCGGPISPELLAEYREKIRG